MGGGAMSQPPTFVASFRISEHDQIRVEYLTDDKVPHHTPDRMFYLSFGSVSTWLTVEELDSLQQQASLALLAYDEQE